MHGEIKIDDIFKGKDDFYEKMTSKLEMMGEVHNCNLYFSIRIIHFQVWFFLLSSTHKVKLTIVAIFSAQFSGIIRIVEPSPQCILHPATPSSTPPDGSSVPVRH